MLSPTSRREEMTHIYNRSQTFQYFATFADLYDTYVDESNFHPRDKLLLGKILPRVSEPSLKVVNYGCGGGHLLIELAKRGHSVLGIEPNPTLRSLAVNRLERHGYSGTLVQLGGIDSLATVESASVDMFVAMGVFQYLPDEEYKATLEYAHRIIRPNGHLIVTFQNSLFDLFTFNKYTLDFFEHQLFASLQHAGLDVRRAVESLRELITHPDLPEHDKMRARDNIFVRLSNPLTIKDELARFGFDLEGLYFYAFQPVPPLIAKDLGEGVKRIAEALELEKSQEWYAYFTGSAFLTHSCAR